MIESVLIYQIIIIILLIVMSAFFSSSETALTSISEDLLQKKHVQPIKTGSDLYPLQIGKEYHSRHSANNHFHNIEN